MTTTDQTAFGLYYSATSDAEQHAKAYYEECVASLTASIVEEGGLTIGQAEVDALISETVQWCEACLGPFRAEPIVRANPGYEASSEYIEGRAYAILFDAVRKEVYGLRD